MMHLATGTHTHKLLDGAGATTNRLTYFASVVELVTGLRAQPVRVIVVIPIDLLEGLARWKSTLLLLRNHHHHLSDQVSRQHTTGTCV